MFTGDTFLEGLSGAYVRRLRLMVAMVWVYAGREAFGGCCPACWFALMVGVPVHGASVNVDLDEVPTRCGRTRCMSTWTPTGADAMTRSTSCVRRSAAPTRRSTSLFCRRRPPTPPVATRRRWPASWPTPLTGRARSASSSGTAFGQAVASCQPAGCRSGGRRARRQRRRHGSGARRLRRAGCRRRGILRRIRLSDGWRRRRRSQLVLPLLLAGGAGVGVLLWRRRKRRQAEAAERARAEEADRQLLKAEISVLADDVVRLESGGPACIPKHRVTSTRPSPAIGRRRPHSTTPTSPSTWSAWPGSSPRPATRWTGSGRSSMAASHRHPPEELQRRRSARRAGPHARRRAPAGLRRLSGRVPGRLVRRYGSGLFSGLLLGSLLTGGFGGWGRRNDDHQRGGERR